MLKFTNIPTGYSYKKEDSLFLDKNIWQKSRDKYLASGFNPNYTVPVLNRDGDFVCVGIEDEVADLQMRILSEISGTEGALTFKDIYPEYKCVRIVGCNELAFRFALYLKSIDMPVILVGNEWSIFIEADENTESFPETSIYNIFANGVSDCDYLKAMTTTVSVEFECINKIYKENISQKKLNRINEDSLIEILLKGKPIGILGVEGDGTGIDGANLYDYLLSKGIDADYFIRIDDTWKCKKYLGKEVLSVEQFISREPQAIILDTNGCGEVARFVNIFSRYGYNMGEKYFVTKDIVVTPQSLMGNVVKNNRVTLIGDSDIGNMIKDYYVSLCNCDANRINIIDYDQVIKANEKLNLKNDELIFSVDIPLRGLSYKTPREYAAGPGEIYNALKSIGIDEYSRYFSYHSVLMEIASQLFKNEKPAIKDAPSLKVACVEPLGGNTFFRGVVDSHPDIIVMAYDAVWDELFFICCKLAYGERDFISFFKEYHQKIVEQFAGSFEKFEEKYKEYIQKIEKEKLSPQDYVILIHLVFNDFLRPNYDYSGKVIYWEPHHWPRKFFSKLASWVKAGGYKSDNTMFTRNFLTRYGSIIRWEKNVRKNITDLYYFEYLNTRSIFQGDYFKEPGNERYIRFEDAKLHPESALLKLCKDWEISWNDSLLKVTTYGNEFGFDTNERVVYGFDTAPVFNYSTDYLSEINRTVLGMANYEFQKRYGYECENPNDYTMSELQDLCNREIRYFENLPDSISKEDYIRIKKKRLSMLMLRFWEMRMKNNEV